MILHNVTRFEDITQTQYSSQHCDFPYILHMHECIKSSFQKKIGSKQYAPISNIDQFLEHRECLQTLINVSKYLELFYSWDFQNSTNIFGQIL